MTKQRKQRVWPEDEEITDPKPYDMIIPVIGMTGSGKSTFINTLTNGSANLLVSHGVNPCTKSVQSVVVTHPQDPTHRIVFLDTPGLNNYKSPDPEILERVAAWLKKCYTGRMKLAGVIFMYEISQARDLSWARNNLEYFGKQCGDIATQNVILATTKWDAPPKQQQLDREIELRKQGHWGELIWRGSRMSRLDDMSFEAAWRIVNLSLEDAFTFDTAKILDDVKQIRESLGKKGGGLGLIVRLEELLESQNRMAQELKTANGATYANWNELVENDKSIRDTLRQIDIKVPLSQRIKTFFGLS